MQAAQWHGRKLWNLAIPGYRVPGLLSVRCFECSPCRFLPGTAVSFQFSKQAGTWTGSNKLPIGENEWVF